MLTEEQEKALLEELEQLRHDKAVLISRVSSLEQSLYWLRKKVFGRMSEESSARSQPTVPVLKSRNVLHGNIPNEGGSPQKL